MNGIRWQGGIWLVGFLAFAQAAQAQINPHIGYVYPAGGCRGSEFEVTVGGQYLDGASRPLFSGEGVAATVVSYWKPLSQREVNELRDKLQEVQKKVQEERREMPLFGRMPNGATFRKIAEEMGVSEEDLEKLADARRKRNDPKRQPNPQIEEMVTLKVTVASDAATGPRELRLPTAAGLSNPLVFQVGQFRECRESEPNDKAPDTAIDGPLPAIINGQIMPGDVDRFAFGAAKGQRLVVAVAAQELIPYLADAVPGWFQAAIALYDGSGKKVAFADDFRFHPDPVLYYQIPEDGTYILEINDAVYRGREDFVYRITLGEMPFVTGVFPLGARRGETADVELSGWEIPIHHAKLDVGQRRPGLHMIPVLGDDQAFGIVPFAVDSLAECLEHEPNDQPGDAQAIETPLIVNGRIDRPGDWDVYRFEGRAGQRIVAEVLARRLGSPLDSLIELSDADGRRLAVNDDWDDKADGLTTHHADSRLTYALPADGVYCLRLGDTQQKGGSAYAYRLRLSSPRPDFELRVVPSSVNVRPGATVPITVFALRRDGFSGDVTLALKDAPAGVELSGAWVPGAQDQVRMTLTVPPMIPAGRWRLSLEGTATVDGRQVRHQAVPAEDMMQAFVFRHLVPAEDWIVTVIGQGRRRAGIHLVDQRPIELPVGGTASARFSVRGGPLPEQVKLELSDPPDGITIDRIVPGYRGADVVLAADAEKVKAGLKGNLLIDAFIEMGGRGGAPAPRNARRVPVGVLPAVAFEVVTQ